MQGKLGLVVWRGSAYLGKSILLGVGVNWGLLHQSGECYVGRIDVTAKLGPVHTERLRLRFSNDVADADAQCEQYTSC